MSVEKTLPVLTSLKLKACRSVMVFGLVVVAVKSDLFLKYFKQASASLNAKVTDIDQSKRKSSAG